MIDLIRFDIWLSHLTFDRRTKVDCRTDILIVQIIYRCSIFVLIRRPWWQEGRWRARFRLVNNSDSEWLTDWSIVTCSDIVFDVTIDVTNVANMFRSLSTLSLSRCCISSHSLGGPGKRQRRMADIDLTRLIDRPIWLDIDVDNSTERCRRCIDLSPLCLESGGPGGKKGGGGLGFG